MKIPIQLSLKYFDEQVTVKKKVEDMHIGEFMDMQKNILIPIFTEKAYEDAIMNQAKRIRMKRKYPILIWLKKIFIDYA
jgi:hypothetical protein